MYAIRSYYGVGEVCEKYERGRHTTVAAILSTLSDGVTRVIDTPGFRRLAVRGIDPATLGACFPEIRAASAGCALGSRCKHLDEPGCAVAAALETGEVHEDRYESYARILAELEDTRGYAKKAGRPRRRNEDDYEDACVITSYSIHYTKLYEGNTRRRRRGCGRNPVAIARDHASS